MPATRSSRSYLARRRRPKRTFTVSTRQPTSTAPSQTQTQTSRSIADAGEDPSTEVIMALEMGRKNALGCAYYVAHDEKLSLMEDIQMASSGLVSQLRAFIQPSTVILSTRARDETVQVFDPHFNSSSADAISDPFNLPFTMDFRSPSEFDYEAAKIKLINLQIGAFTGPRVALAVPGDQNGFDDQDELGHQARMLQLSALVSTDGRLSVGCAGAVIAYIQRRRAAAFLPGDLAANHLFRISTVSMFTLKDHMFVNMDTVLSLQILQSESHPSSHNQGPTKASSGSKEGLSVFGLFQHLAKSPQGRIALKQLFLQPLADLNRINERLDAVSVLARPESNSVVETIRASMSNIKHVKSLLSILGKGAAGGSGQGGRVANRIWSGLHSFAFYSIRIYHVLGEIPCVEQLPFATKFANRFNMQDITAVGRMISETVDIEESTEQLRTVVRQGVDDDLDHRKHTYHGIEDLLSKVAEKLREDIPAGLPQDLKTVYFPQIGFLIALPKDREAGIALFEGLEDENWENMFSSENVVYYKDDRMRQMDEHFGDIYTQICDREIEIIHELAMEVLKFQESLEQASEACAELDCLLALAEGAKRYSFNRPRMTQDNVLQIEEGRHPLQELTVPAFIPNDTFVASSSQQASIASRSESYFSSSPSPPEGPSMLILTGPNFSGKSVYLKQAAIITYMAHVGSFVPAAKASVGITDKLLVRIATRESVSRSQSAFMVDLQQVSMALSLATNRSLLIIDEFGKGTAANDGAGLAAGLFEHLASLGNAKRPRVLAATHFHEIFVSGILQTNANIAFAHMEIRLDEKSDDAREQVTYLYNLRAGPSSDSFGTVCAAMNGIADAVVQRAESLALIAARGEDLVAACATLSRIEIDDLTKAERTAREFLAQDIQGDPHVFLDNVLRSEESDE